MMTNSIKDMNVVILYFHVAISDPGKVETFEEAQSFCNKMHGHLVELESDTEFDYVKSLMGGRQEKNE